MPTLIVPGVPRETLDRLRALARELGANAAHPMPYRDLIPLIVDAFSAARRDRFPKALRKEAKQ